MRLKNIVTIGGGTGSFMLLSGLKKYPVNISAIVSMADDGGSTGMLRDELGVLPPGDVRQCLVALSESSETLRKLMNYRFKQGGLKGHNFGNIFLSALEKVSGNFEKGVEEASKILNIKGKVIPVINKSVRMHIKLKNGKIIIGENNLDHNEEIRRIGLEKIFLKPIVPANRKALEKIKKADLIIIGPGDYYGSIMPNLLAKNIPEAINNSRARIIYVCNLTNKKGQTDNFSLEKYTSEINKMLGSSKIDTVIFNNKKINPSLIKKYETREGKSSVVKKMEEVKLRYKIIEADIIRNIRIEAIKNGQSFIRHDSDKLAKVIMKIMNKKI
ncbi:MAG: gluconeogenesis factor YvcK family protein [Candidatus Moraniibacteriota bacterium]